MRSFVDDLRYAFRQMMKSPGFAAVAIITLALGIGANTAVFSVIDAVMLRPLPYDRPETLIDAQSAGTQNPQASSVSYPDFFDWRAQNRTLDHLVSYHDNSFHADRSGAAAACGWRDRLLGPAANPGRKSGTGPRLHRRRGEARDQSRADQPRLVG